MNFEKWWETQTEHLDFYQGRSARKSWNKCKEQILKILEDEIDNGDCSIIKATRKIRKKI